MVGGVEVIVLLVIVLVLFGPTLVAFWLGYSLGKKKTAEKPVPPVPPAAPAAPRSDRPSPSEPPAEEQYDE